MSTPINIPRNLASSRPPQDDPFSPPSFKQQPIASSFDYYCGHIENNDFLRKQWREEVKKYTKKESASTTDDQSQNEKTDTTHKNMPKQTQ